MAKVKTKKEELVKEISDDLKKVSVIEALSTSEGGMVLIKGLAQDIITDLNKLSNNFSTYTLQEFIAIGASLKTNMEMIRALSKANSNKKFLEELLEETLNETE